MPITNTASRITLERHGGHLHVLGDHPFVESILADCRHRVAPSDEGVNVEPYVIEQQSANRGYMDHLLQRNYDLPVEPLASPSIGLESAIEYACAGQELLVHRQLPPPLCPSPVLLHHPLVEFVACHESGLVRVGSRPESVKCLSLLVQGCPHSRMAIIATRRKTAIAIRDRLVVDAPALDVELMRTGRLQSTEARVVVGTAKSMVKAQLESRCDLLLLVDADEAARNSDVAALLHETEQARLFGFIDDRRFRHLAQLDVELLWRLYGFEQLRLADANQLAREVRTVFVTFNRGPSPRHNATAQDVRQQGIVRHACRNRHVARVATAIAAGNSETLRLDFPAFDRFATGNRSRTNTVVVVDSVEHAVQLGHRLPDWPVLVAQGANLGSLPRSDQRRMSHVSAGLSLPARAIVTMPALEDLPLDTADVLIRADGTAGVPHELSAKITPLTATGTPLTIIDFNDRHHPMLRRWSKYRRRDYARLEWLPVGADPVEDRMKRYLAPRIGAIA